MWDDCEVDQSVYRSVFHLGTKWEIDKVDKTAARLVV